MSSGTTIPFYDLNASEGLKMRVRGIVQYRLI
jgi:hypothetical protein